MVSKGLEYFNIIVLYLALAASLNLLRAKGETYIVGDSDGWDNFKFNGLWLKGKSFYYGDVLVFNYDPSSHNVMQVNKTAFENCLTDTYTAVFASGNDSVALTTPGEVYFICGNHCKNDQKVLIYVEE